MFSKYCSDIASKYGIKVGGVKKLIPNLGDKIKYVVRYKNLQYYLSLGMKLVKARVSYFYQNFIFSQNDSPSKTMRNIFYFI